MAESTRLPSLSRGLSACNSRTPSSSRFSPPSSGSSPESSAASPSAAAEGPYIGVMLSTNVMSLDCNLATDGDSFEVIADCIDGLTQMDADGAAVPALAESWDVS